MSDAHESAVSGDQGRLCSFPDCGAKHYGRGYCRAHLWQLNHGVELRPVRRVRQGGTCTKCPKPHKARGLCAAHYREWERENKRGAYKPEAARARVRAPRDRVNGERADGRTCTLYEGCTRPLYAKGGCQAHYQQLSRGLELHAIAAQPAWLKGKGGSRNDHKLPKGWDAKAPAPKRPTPSGDNLIRFDQPLNIRPSFEDDEWDAAERTVHLMCRVLGIDEAEVRSAVFGEEVAA